MTAAEKTSLKKTQKKDEWTSAPKYTEKIPEPRYQFIVYLPAIWLDCPKKTTTLLSFLMDTGAEVNVMNYQLVPKKLTRPAREVKKVSGAGGKVLVGGDRELHMSILLEGHTNKNESVMISALAQFYVMDIGRQPFAGILSCRWMEEMETLLDVARKNIIFRPGWAKNGSVTLLQGPPYEEFTVKSGKTIASKGLKLICPLTV